MERIELGFSSLDKSMKLRIGMMLLLLQGVFLSTAYAVGVGGSGMYQWSVGLRGYVSQETGKAPVAYLWVPQGCQKVRAVMHLSSHWGILLKPLFHGTLLLGIQTARSVSSPFMAMRLVQIFADMAEIMWNGDDIAISMEYQV